mmetsp:Transcript_12213/g.23163  ORF Transcript_12213/g.23163 Transcript_12213/m.23163 type:complete len:483 (-) Transcript_12213:246-1694(-)
MELEVHRAQDVYSLLAREKSSRQWVLEACNELGFDIKSLKNRNLADFQVDASNNAIQRLRYEHYMTRRNFKIEKVVEFLADRGLLDEFQIRYVDEKRRGQSASPSVYRKTPANDTTFLTDLSLDVKTVDLNASRAEKIRKVQENLMNMKLDQEKKRLEQVKTWSQRYSKLEKDHKKIIQDHHEKYSLKDKKRKDLLAKRLQKESQREEAEIQNSIKKLSARESGSLSRAPESGRGSRSNEDQVRPKFVDKPVFVEDVGKKLLHIETKLERSEILAQEHKKSKSSTAAAAISQVSKVKLQLREREMNEQAMLVQKVLRLKSEHDKSARSRKRLLNGIAEKLNKEHMLKRERSQREHIKQQNELLAKEQVILAKEAEHEERLHKLKVEKQRELELSFERQLLRQIDQRKNFELKQKTQDKLKNKVLTKQFANEEHVKRLRSAMEHRSQLRHMSNEQLRRQKSLAKERLDEELNKLYKSSQYFLN